MFFLIIRSSLLAHLVWVLFSLVCLLRASRFARAAPALVLAHGEGEVLSLVQLQIYVLLLLFDDADHLEAAGLRGHEDSVGGVHSNLRY